jgi:hypothetical protein
MQIRAGSEKATDDRGFRRHKHSISEARSRAARSALLAAALLFGSAACPARALDVGPKNIPLTVAGVPVEIPVTGSLDAQTDASRLRLKATATGDLQSIKDNALAIARGIRLPKDSCARNGVNIVIKSIDSASIEPVGSSAQIEISGQAAVWACTKMFGAPLKTRVAEDSFTVTASVELFLPNPRTIALRLSGPAKLTTGHSLTTEAADVFVHDVNAALTAQLSKLLDAARARAAVPPLPGLEVDIATAAFAQRGTSLTVHGSGRATMTSEAFVALLGFLAH